MVRLAHAEALAVSGQWDLARAALADAHGRLLARAERIEEPAWRHRFLHDVPVNARILSLAEEWRAGSPAVSELTPAPSPPPSEAVAGRRRATTSSNSLA